MKRKIGVVLLVVALALVMVMPPSLAAAGGAKPPKGLHWDVNFVTQLAYTEPLFNDIFNIDLSQWTQLSGTWVIVDDSGNNVCSVSDGSHVGGVVATAGSDGWTNYTLDLDAKKVAGRYLYVIFRYTDQNNHYLLAGGHHITLFRKVGGGGYERLTPLGQETFPDQWYHYKVVLQGPSIKVYVDGTLQIDIIDNSLPAGKVGIGAYTGSAAYFDNVQVIGVNPNEILIPLNDTGYVQWTFGADFQVVDNDANVIDGDKAIVQFPWNMDMYVWWLSARGKPGKIEENNITGDGHTTWYRSTGAPTWQQWPGTYSWTGGVNGHTASLVNNGVTNLGLRVYPNQP